MTRRKWFVAAAALMALAALLYLRRQPDTDARQAALMMRQFRLRPGMTVADVGAGDGHFAFRLARELGGSMRFYVTEIDPKRLKLLRAGPPANVTVIEGGVASARLPDSCCDLVYLRRVFHHFTSPAAMNGSLYRAVRPGGTIAVIDAPARLSLNLTSPQLEGPRNRWWHGIASSSVARELRTAGFRIEGIVPWPDGDYCVIGRKPVLDVR